MRASMAMSVRWVCNMSSAHVHLQATFSLRFAIQDGKLVINLEQLRVMGVGEMLAFFAIVL